jgi:type IV secretion system protein VirD4
MFGKGKSPGIAPVAKVLGDPLAEMPRGVPGRALDEHATPAAEFADPEKVLRSPAFAFDRSKLLLGVLGGRIDRASNEYTVRGGQAVGYGDNRHAVLCAGSRAGKGRSCLIPTLLEYGGSVLALDPKGELADITARWRGDAQKGLGQRVCVVDPFGVTADRLKPFRVGYNPMTLLRLKTRAELAAGEKDTTIEDAGLIADALVGGEGHHDPHWDDSARTLIEGLLLHVATWGGYANDRNLPMVRDVLMRRVSHTREGGEVPEDGDDKKDKLLKREMLANADRLAEQGFVDVADVIEGAANDYFDRPPNERGSVLSTARRHTKFLDYPPLRESLRHSGFDLRDLKRAPKGLTIYLCLPAGRMGTCSRWFRLFVNLALQAMEDEPTMPAIPVLAVLEEFHVLGAMRQLEVAAGMIAGFGMKLLIVLQDLTQLKRHYKDGWETFLGNAGVMVFFGNSDLTTLEFISKRCGTTSMIVDRQSDVTSTQQVGGQTGKSWSLEVRELLTPEEAARLFGRDNKEQRALVIRAGQPTAMVVQRVKYDQHEMFVGKWDKR